MGRALAVSVAAMSVGRFDAPWIGRIADVTGLVAGASRTRLPGRRFVRYIRGRAVAGTTRSGVGTGFGNVTRSSRVRHGPSIAERHLIAAREQQGSKQTDAFHGELAVCTRSDCTRFASGLLGYRTRKRLAAAFPAARLPLLSKASIRSASASGPRVRCLN
jgi:hypothetical protein